MTYKFDLERDFEATPFIDGLGTAVIEFALGYDLERDKVIVMSVLLVRGDSYLEGKIANVFDLQFGTRERDVTSGEVGGLDFSAASAATWIPAQFRSDVAQVLLEAIGALIAAIKPTYVTMETYYGNLPPKALKKYTIICEKFAANGYTIYDQFRDATSGIDYWLFGRAAIETDTRRG
jgi:hypothetical protein